MNLNLSQKEAHLNRYRILACLLGLALLLSLIAGCDKERIVESTEIVHEIEYVELPPDTVIMYDTIVTYDSVNVHTTDTLIIHDTITVTRTDTVTTVVVHYDTTTVIVTDTVIQASNEPNELLAIGALQFYVDPLVLDFANQEFGLNDGWIYYLSTWQSDFTKQSTGVYDIYGYIEYWAPDWSGYYPLEFFYRISHTGGDPADVTNWTLSEPSSGSSIHDPGMNSITTEKLAPGALTR